jgi:phytoene dehydrogenase-like protein
MTTVPDFFQDEGEEALRSQVEWQGQHLGLGEGFFARLLREDQGRFASWARDADTLTRDKEEVLRDWWQTVLHLLSFQSFDEGKVRALLEQRAPTDPQAGQSLFSPPWSASSLKEYLENHGPDAITEVQRWVESFRFGDPYAQPPKERPCLSTRP